MPTFNDTWISPNASIPSIGIKTARNPHENLSSESKQCGLCDDDFNIEDSPRDTQTRPPCDNLSCAECTWLRRNRNTTCQRCAAHFTCTSQEQASPSSEADDLRISSYGTGVPDEEYEGDDERGAISTFKTPAMKHTHHSPTNKDPPRLETKIGGIDRQVSRSKHARKIIAKPASGNQEPGGQGRGYITTGDGPMGLGFGVTRGRRKGKGKGKAGGDIVARS